MMTRELEVSILAAPLAAIDPRALSQAWYSALRLARVQALPVQSGRVLMQAPPPRMQRRDGAQTSISPPGAQRPSRRALDAGARAFAVSPNAVRWPRPPSLAARIERVFAGARSQPRRATFSMGRGNARVHVILQTKGERTMLLAICKPELRGTVGSALAAARIALTARGVGLELRLLGGRGCFSTLI